MSLESSFLTAYRGKFTSALRWGQLTQLWDTLRSRANNGWYIYAVGESPPTRPSSPGEVAVFIDEMDTMLRREHREDYCGIVYADDLAKPSFVKIYDPNNLGNVCGPGPRGAPPPLPGWILSTIAPEDLHATVAVPGNRRRWWQRLFHDSA